MLITKVMRTMKEVKDEEIRGNLLMIISSIVEYSVSRAKLNLSYLVMGFMDEQLLLSLMKSDENKLKDSLKELNEISMSVIGENIYSGRDPEKFALQLFSEFHEKPIPYDRIKD